MREGFFDWAPVRDLHGREVRFVAVAPREMTCMVCGETTGEDYCLRCSDFQEGIVVRDLAPTIGYLQADEYVVVS